MYLYVYVCFSVCSMEFRAIFITGAIQAPGEMFNLLHTTFWKIEK